MQTLAPTSIRGRKVFVTSASGFIGQNLVRHLLDNNCEVTCAVRPGSNTTALQGCRLEVVEITDPRALRRVIDGHEYVFHLASCTAACSAIEFDDVNVEGTRAVLEACAMLVQPPTVVHVSSLAAVGPSDNGLGRIEFDECFPVSAFGESKLAAEAVCYQYCRGVPLSILRPPIVFGAYDQKGFEMFRKIDRMGTHFIAGRKGKLFSIIHVDDLIDGMLRIASQGERLDVRASTPACQGIYHIAANEALTYESLGEMIGRQLHGRPPRNVVVPAFALQSMAAFNSLAGKMTRRPKFLNRDKAKEALAGSWTCSSTKIRAQLGFHPAFSLAERIQQTIAWYRQHGWLSDSIRETAELQTPLPELPPMPLNEPVA